MKVQAYKEAIVNETGLTIMEINERVEQKKVELKGLVSDEGALFIIAKELGLDFSKKEQEIEKIMSNYDKIRQRAQELSEGDVSKLKYKLPGVAFFLELNTQDPDNGRAVAVPNYSAGVKQETTHDEYVWDVKLLKKPEIVNDGLLEQARGEWKEKVLAQEPGEFRMFLRITLAQKFIAKLPELGNTVRMMWFSGKAATFDVPARPAAP